MELEGMTLLMAVEAAQHVDERRLRVDAGLGRIGDRGVHVRAGFQPAGRRDRVQEPRPHAQHVRPRQQPLDQEVAVRVQAPGKRFAIVQEARGIEEIVHGGLSRVQSLSRPPVTLRRAAVM